ncbi:unnamed protein product [Prunus brigantina]
MDDDGDIDIFFSNWNNKNPTDGLFIVSCLIAALWRRNINLSWMKEIARSNKNPKARHKVPIAPHTLVLESVSRGKNLNCCVCLNSMSPSQTLGPMTASDSFSRSCSICGATAHLSCSSSRDQTDEASFCSYYEEPCSGSFLGGSPIWCCLWCQRLVRVDCHSSMSNETCDICDLGPFRSQTSSAGGFLSSITQGQYQLASLLINTHNRTNI